MSYQVLSRKYRPKSFNEIVGQDHITTTLRKAIEAGRVGQAYIFAGTRGTGKTTIARIFAKALNCEKGPTPDPCNDCGICRSIDAGDDIDVIEIDGASHNSVEDVRELRSNAGYRPARGRFKIYYIDEVHMLSNAAFNALLKTLEEPPAHVKFIFSTTEPHRIPATILSRCQRFDFRNIPPADILARLAFLAESEGIEAGEGALELLTRFAAGSIRDGESLLDQVASFAGDRIDRSAVAEVLGVVPTEALSELLTALAGADTAGALMAVEAILSGGTAARRFVNEFIDYLRDVLVSLECGADSKLLVRSASERELIAQDSRKWNREALIYAMALLSETYARFARFPQSRGLLDIAILKLARVEDFVRLRETLSDAQPGGSSPPRAEGRSSRPFDAGGGGKPSASAKSPVSLEKAVVEAAKRLRNIAARTLESGGVFTVTDEVVRITLPSNGEVAASRLKDGEVVEAMEKAAGEVLGRAVRVVIECGGPANAGATQAPAANKGARYRSALQEPSVRRVMELFGGNIHSVEE